ncbi:unnamed protein product [Camellia sinensis]
MCLSTMEKMCKQLMWQGPRDTWHLNTYLQVKLPRNQMSSFGIVALEIACGKKSFDWKVPENQTLLVEWVWDLYATNRLLEAVDPKIYADFVREEMECLMIVGLWCAHPDHNLRPSIKQVIHVLNFEAPLPILPTKMLVPTYVTPSG